MTSFAWSDLAFSSKTPLRALKATFIAAPRQMSSTRLKQLIKTLLPQGNIVLGLSTNDFVTGFDSQPQFRTLSQADIGQLIQKLNAASPHSLSTVTYNPRDEPHIIAKDLFARYIFINGSWTTSFHLRPSFFALTKLRAHYQLLSPFADEAEAKAYEQALMPEVEASTPMPKAGTIMTAHAAMNLAAVMSQRSFDHTFQTGVVLAQPQTASTYKFITATYNAVVPYQTSAMHHGSARERHFSPPGDLNYYDTNHAEMALIAQATRRHLDLARTTLFINLLPCPTCARVIGATDIAQIIYQLDHSDGYANQHLIAMGKTVGCLPSEQP